ncbi:unnamed protein product [Pedinophyceae sp. YPF-701]|nr:unnamed protein product [Pedinophyceae sp. YPF-701]
MQGLAGSALLRPVAPARPVPARAATAHIPARHFAAARPFAAPARTGRHHLLIVKAVDNIEAETQGKFEKTLEKITESFTSVRTGRANPSMLDRVNVDYYGAATPLNSIAGISVTDATTLVIQPYDMAAMKDIEKALMESDLGMTPNNDGKVIRLILPPLTEERRKELTKTVSKLGEEGKVAVRNIRRDAMKAVEKAQKDKDSPISEDEAKGLEEAIQKLTDAAVKKVEEAVAAKSKELTTV